MHNHAESLRIYANKSFLDPKRAKFDEKLHFGHVQTCQGQSRPAKASPGGQVLVSKAVLFLRGELTHVLFCKVPILSNVSHRLLFLPNQLLLVLLDWP